MRLLLTHFSVSANGSFEDKSNFSRSAMRKEDKKNMHMKMRTDLKILLKARDIFALNNE